jgi:hypothetical protein
MLSNVCVVLEYLGIREAQVLLRVQLGCWQRRSLNYTDSAAR